MAKQVGLFGLRGKIENKSFYKTAGVADTVIRQIPEGMSARVKTGDEYANTRLNNSEFKNANGIATFAFNTVPSRKSSMMRRFAIAEMTKKGLEFIKAGTGSWGARIPSEKMDAILVDLLENRAKSGPYQGEFGFISSSRGNDNEFILHLSYDSAVATELASKGIDGVYALLVKGAMAEIVDSDGFVRQHFGVSSISVAPHGISPEGEEIDLIHFKPTPQNLGMSPAGYTAASQAANNGIYAVLTFLPYRLFGDKRYILHEYATYAALALGAIPTE